MYLLICLCFKHAISCYFLLYAGLNFIFDFSLQKVLELPLLMKRIFLEMMDPDREDYLHEMRLFAVR